jgi:hypothetical protein
MDSLAPPIPKRWNLNGEGLSYGVQTAVHELDGHTVHALASTDAMVEHATKAGSALLDVADVPSLTGPDPSELQFIASAMDEVFSDPQSVVGEIQGMVQAILLGRAPTGLEQRKAEMAALDGMTVPGAHHC